MAGEFAKRRLVALGADDGSVLWAKDANYRHRPIIVGDRVIAEPWAFNLYNGEQQMRVNTVTDSSRAVEHHAHRPPLRHDHRLREHALLPLGFTGFYDLTADVGTQHFAGHRLGCWINAIPANGLVMIPEAGAGCVCLFSIESTVVFEPREPRRPWAIYSSVGKLTPVQAPGRSTSAHRAIVAMPTDNVWLTYPRPKPYHETGLEANLDLEPSSPTAAATRASTKRLTRLPGAETPWLFTSAAHGLATLSVAAGARERSTGEYTVKLYFTDLDNAEAGQRVFDVELEGNRMDKQLDIAALGDGKGKPVVREYKDVEIDRKLTLRLVPSTDADSLNELPVLSAVEVIRSADSTAK